MAFAQHANDAIARQILALLGPVASQHPQAFGLALGLRHCEIGAEVEQVVLD